MLGPDSGWLPSSRCDGGERETQLGGDRPTPTAVGTSVFEVFANCSGITDRDRRRQLAIVVSSTPPRHIDGWLFAGAGLP